MDEAVSEHRSASKWTEYDRVREKFFVEVYLMCTGLWRHDSAKIHRLDEPDWGDLRAFLVFMSPCTDIDVHHFERLQFLAVVDFDLLKYKGFNLHRGT